MPKRMTVLVVLMAVISLIFVGVVPAVAQGGGQPLVLQIDVDESGTWVLTVDGVEEQLRSQDVDVVSAALGLGLPPLSLSPDVVNRAQSSGIGYAGLVKEDEDFTIFVNGSPLAALGVREGAVSALVSQTGPDMQQVLSAVLDSDFGLSARLPGAEGEPPSLDSRVAAAAAAGEVANTIDLGLTMSPDGELISIGGIDAQTLGLAIRVIDLSPYRDLLQQWGISTVGLDVIANTINFTVNQNEWLSLALNLDYLRDNLGLVTGLAGVQLNDQMQQYIAVAMDWLEDTELYVDAYLASEPQEEPLSLALDRPIVLSIRDNSVYVEGINTGFALDAMTAGYLSKLGSVALVWDGEGRELRSVVTQKPMPVIVLEEGFVAKAGSTFAGEAVAPWTVVDSILGNVRLTSEVVYEDSLRPPLESLAYEVATKAPVLGMTVDISVSRSNGGVSVWGISLPLAAVAPNMQEMVRTYANQYGGIGTMALDLGPAGLTVDLAGSQAHVRWDGETRSNLLSLALDTFGSDFGLPAVITSGPGRTALEGIVSFVNAFGVKLDVTVVDEDIQEGTLGRLLGAFQ